MSVRRVFGLALYVVQAGERPPEAKTLSGFGSAAVLELREDDGGGTYRTIYTVRFTSAVYVLHVFQKKSKRGIATPKADLDLVHERLKVAERVHAAATRAG